jgi:protease I
MADDNGKKVAIIATDYFEEAELLKPLEALQTAGITAEVVAPHDGTIKGLKHTDPAQAATVDKTLDEVHAGDYDAVVLPGGVVNADHLRVDEKAQEFVKDMMKAGKLIAVICHGPWLLVSAGLVKGRTLTSYHTLQDDIINAGGTWVDQQVVKDGNLITSRTPADLPAFNQAILEALES